MDLTKSSPSFKIDKRFINLITLLPGFWLTFYIFSLALSNLKNINTSRDMWNGETNSLLLAEFIKYRNFFYSIYILLACAFGIYVLVNGVKKFFNKGKGSDEKDKYISYVIPASIRGLIFVTFSFALAGLLVDLYKIVIKFI